MLIDALNTFVPYGTPLSLVAGAGIAIPSSQIIDLLGNGVGQAPTSIIGTTAVYGDAGLGVGQNRPELEIAIGIAAAAAAGTTLKVALQGAPDLGAGGSYQPGTWQDIVSQDNISLANLAAGNVIARFPWIPPMPPNLLARYLRLLFSPQINNITPSGNFTAGTIAWALVTTVRDDYAVKYAAKNYIVS